MDHVWPEDSGDPGRFVIAADPFPDPLPRPLPRNYAHSGYWRGPHREAECPAFERRSARWQESAFIARNPRAIPGKRPWTRGCCVNLARFTVPNGSTGIIHRIALSIEVPDEEQPEGPGTAAWFLGLDPFILTRPGVLGPGGLTFHLRLERQRRDNERGNLGIVTQHASTLPGLPHPELGSWQDSRYWFGICDRPTRIRVPEDHIASLWVEMNPALPFIGVLEEIRAWYGLLAGHVWQYGENPPAYWDAQRGLL